MGCGMWDVGSGIYDVKRSVGWDKGCVECEWMGCDMDPCKPWRPTRVVVDTVTERAMGMELRN